MFFPALKSEQDIQLSRTFKISFFITLHSVYTKPMEDRSKPLSLPYILQKTTSVLSLTLLLLVASCGSPEPESSPTPLRTEAPTYVESGDLAAIQNHGYLRILSPPQSHTTHLPRQGFPQNHEHALLERFAESMGLKLGYVAIERYQNLIPYLLEGKGDLIAANFTVTPKRKERVSFTVPITTVKEQIITRQDDTQLQALKDLNGRTLAVHRSLTFWNTASTLQQQNPNLHLQETPEHMDIEQILDGVAQNEFDLTLADSNVVKAVLSYRSDLRPALTVTEDRPVAWGVRTDATALLTALNMFLNKVNLAHHRPSESHDDWLGIKKRGVLRVLTRNNPATYFLWRGELMGFEYELARHFAKQHKLRVEVVVPPTREDLIPWLLEGKGDLIAASMTINKQRQHQGVEFSQPYLTASEILVARADEPEDHLASVEDLAGRTVVVRKSSAYWQTLQQFQRQGIAVKIQAAPEDIETEELIAKVAEGEYDLTVADSHILDIDLTWREDIRAAFPLGDPQPLGWAVRASNPKLLQATNQFMKKEYRGLFYNITLKKYFKDSRTIRKHVDTRTTQTGELSPYDDIVQRYAKQFGFDWRLIVSQMYQESRFNPNARSWAGAVGLMQVLPRTARSLGFKDLTTPEKGIHAGVEYLNWVRERFDAELPVAVRTWFTLAAYNAGQGHVRDARRLARKLGLNPDRWFGHVEKAIQLLAKKKYARQARHGYCRGLEPVKYVREIKHRYEAYQQATTL